MLYRKLLVAYDGSESSLEALTVAKDLIGNLPDATMIVLSVIPLGAVGVGIDSPIQPIGSVQQIFPDAETYEKLLEKARTSTIENMREDIGNALDEVKCEVVIQAVAASKPANGICEFAEQEKVDMIVMGSRGLGGLRGMIGSVSYGVLHQADCPVVTVR